MDEQREDWRVNNVVISGICRHLDVNSILSIRLVCRTWYEASKGVFAEKAVINLTVPINNSKDTSWKVDTNDNPKDVFQRYAKFIDENPQFRCENLNMDYCPDMKYHSIWAIVGPAIKSLVVFPLHGRTSCQNCVNLTTFTKGLMENFPNLVSLEIRQSKWRIYTSAQDLDEDQLTVRYPAVEKFDSLNQLFLNMNCFDLPRDFIIDHVAQLKELLLYAYTEDQATNETFRDCLEAIADSVDEKHFEILDLSCHHHLNNNNLLETWFSKFSSNETKLTYTAPSAKIEELMDYLPRGDQNLWLSFWVINAWDLKQIEGTIEAYLNRMAWTTSSMTLDFFADHPESDGQAMNVSKLYFPNSSLQLLCIGSKAWEDIEKILKAEKLAEILPAASFMCVSVSGQIIAEVFGPARLLFPNFKNLLDFTERQDNKSGKYLLETAQFRHLVGIPDDWHPPFFGGAEFALTFFSIDFKLINKARRKLHTFVYPETRLLDTYQIFQGYRETPSPDKSQGKAVLKWADPICFELASGKLVCEGPSFRILKTEA